MPILPPLSPQELQASRRRQAIYERLGAKLAASTLSKIPPEQEHLAAGEDLQKIRELREKKRRRDARRNRLPAFLRRHLTRLSQMLKLKLLALSLKASSSSFWLARRTTLRMSVSKFLSLNIRRPKRGAWLKRLVSPTRKKSISGRWPCGSGGNISATNISSPMKESRAFTRSPISFETWRALARRKKSARN